MIDWLVDKLIEQKLSISDLDLVNNKNYRLNILKK